MKIERLYWHGFNLNHVANESIWVSLLKYRQDKDRVQCKSGYANLISSQTNVKGIHMPVIDIDWGIEIHASSTPGHVHLYLNNPITWRRYVVLLCALRYAGVIEKGFLLWSLRRGSTFVRPPGVLKTEDRPTEAVPSCLPRRHRVVRSADGSRAWLSDS